ncbi:hypothetical protein [Dactylosporangium sp. NPDC051484]|uniref:hypothetical protein n=1 Tax=Dactylosporangium sp. NPDC051484 TaxID=3154942 RepID=UPI00344E03CC
MRFGVAVAVAVVVVAGVLAGVPMPPPPGMAGQAVGHDVGTAVGQGAGWDADWGADWDAWPDRPPCQKNQRWAGPALDPPPPPIDADANDAVNAPPTSIALINTTIAVNLRDPARFDLFTDTASRRPGWSRK